MKDKILLSIIFVLVLAIGYINFTQSSFFSKKNIDTNVEKQGKVKAAQIDNTNYSFQDRIETIPQKKDSYYEPENIWANSYLLLDTGSSHVLTKYNENEIVPIASTTKLMTAIIVLENYNLDEVVTISEDAAYQIPSVMGLMPEEKITVHDLLYGLLMKSGNDAAYALAEHMEFDNFIEKMNEKAKYLGLENTHFKDPAGLNDEGRSTARDLSFLASYALKFDTIKEIIRTTEKEVYSINRAYAHQLENSNRLIHYDEPLFYEPSIGGKTGYTPDAGHCLVSAATKDDHTLISVILKTIEDTNDASAKESKKLLEWGFENFIWQTQ